MTHDISYKINFHQARMKTINYYVRRTVLKRRGGAFICVIFVCNDLTEHDINKNCRRPHH